MRLHGLLLAGIFTCTTAFAQNDPFVGTWVYDAQKSPKPTIKYTIKDLGGGALLTDRKYRDNGRDQGQRRLHQDAHRSNCLLQEARRA